MASEPQTAPQPQQIEEKKDNNGDEIIEVKEDDENEKDENKKNEDDNKEDDKDTTNKDDKDKENDDQDDDEKKEKDDDDLAIIIKQPLMTKLKNIKNRTQRRFTQWMWPSEYLQKRGLSLYEIEELLMLYPIKKQTYCVLIDEFLRLCSINDIVNEEATEISNITMDTLMKNCYLINNPFKPRIRILYEQDLKGNVDNITFFDFCKCLSVFAEDTPKAMKIRFAYRIYDMEDDGFISKNNLYDVMSLVLKKKFGDTEIWAIVNDTFKNCSTNNNGDIDFHEFRSIVNVGDILSKYTIHF